MVQESETIKNEIVDQLIWDDTINANDIHVDIIDDTVKLTGKVRSYAAKVAAERDAYYVTGVTNVENHIQITSDVQDFTDEEIADNISNLLLWNGNITSNDISVHVNHGIVVLEGTVDSYWEKRLTEELTRSATGVVDVLNNMDVKLRQPYVDEDIRDDIIRALRRHPVIDENQVGVEVKDGVVTLSGVVANYQIKHQVHKTAQFTAGVKDVVDNIVIM